MEKLRLRIALQKILKENKNTAKNNNIITRRKTKSEEIRAKKQGE